jgi:hypothetical protein
MADDEVIFRVLLSKLFSSIGAWEPCFASELDLPLTLLAGHQLCLKSFRTRGCPPQRP